jgi:hypothetical protein
MLKLLQTICLSVPTAGDKSGAWVATRGAQFCCNEENKGSSGETL